MTDNNAEEHDTPFELVNPRVVIYTTPNELQAGIGVCEWGGRISHKSNTADSGPDEFVARWGVGAGHASILRFAHLTVELTAGRATLNQFVRHHVGGVVVQESQRYVRYGATKHPIAFIVPPTQEEREFYRTHGMQVMQASADAYSKAIATGLRPEQARKYLLLDTASTMRVQYNLEAWRHILKERLCNSAAQLDIRLLMKPVYDFMAKWPWLVNGLEPCLKGMDRVGHGYVQVQHS